MKIHDVQQNTPEWSGLRAGMPTGSEADRLVTPTGKATSNLDAFAIELANELFLGRSTSAGGFRGNRHTQRGHEREPIAALSYEALMDVETQIVGFITDDDVTYGVSPDRLVGDNGLVEIKNLDDQAHTAALVYYKETRKPMPDRMAQCQMQLYTTGRDWVDLFYSHDKLPEFRIRILPIKTYFEMLECQIQEVIERRDTIIKILEAA